MKEPNPTKILWVSLRTRRLLCDEWSGPSGFDRFVSDVGEKQAGHRLVRHDRNAPFGPSNAHWLRQHNLHRTKTYASWSGMQRRCYCVKDRHHLDYAGRGISVCDQWRGTGGFLQFLKDMGECPTGGGWSLDRIDNNGNYEPSNCRWATAKEQGRNTRRVKLKPHEPVLIRQSLLDGKTKVELAKIYGVSTSTIRAIELNKIWVD